MVIIRGLVKHCHQVEFVVRHQTHAKIPHAQRFITIWCTHLFEQKNSSNEADGAYRSTFPCTRNKYAGLDCRL